MGGFFIVYTAQISALIPRAFLSFDCQTPVLSCSATVFFSAVCKNGFLSAYSFHQTASVSINIWFRLNLAGKLHHMDMRVR